MLDSAPGPPGELVNAKEERREEERGGELASSIEEASLTCGLTGDEDDESEI